MIAVRFHRLATREMRAAHAWYFQRDPAVAGRFLNAVDVALARVAKDPDSLAVEHSIYTSIRVRRFPYRLIFEHLQAELVLVIAVAHTSRRPRYWSRRK